MNRTVNTPGVANMWSMPIKNRLDMLATGIKTPVGIKIFGPDLATLDPIGKQIEALLPQVEGTNSVFAERRDRRALPGHRASTARPRAATG